MAPSAHDGAPFRPRFVDTPSYAHFGVRTNQIQSIIKVPEPNVIAKIPRAAHGGHPLFFDLKLVELHVFDNAFSLNNCCGQFENLFNTTSNDIAYAYRLWSSAIDKARFPVIHD